MKNRHAARVVHTPEEPTYSAAIVRFPLTLSVRRTETRESRRPSLALNIVLMLLLVLACVIWEAMTSRNDSTHDLRHNTVTSPRAAIADSRAAG
jgi:hypothetical protein